MIADASHRQHFLAAERSRDKDWRGFFHACVDDPVLAHGRALAAAISSEVTVVILTARVHEIRDQTVDWLAANEIRHDWLILRGPNEHGPSGSWKKARLEDLHAAGATIELCADDDPRNVAMMRGLGIPTLTVPSGYYDGRDNDESEYR